jgi:hypothetical protein
MGGREGWRPMGGALYVTLRPTRSHPRKTPHSSLLGPHASIYMPTSPPMGPLSHRMGTPLCSPSPLMRPPTRQFALLLMAIFENVIVQRLIAHQCTERALRVDRMARNVIPFCIYPIFIGSMVLVGYEHDVAAIVVFFGGCTAVFCLATMAAFSGEWREARARRKFAKKIGPIDLGKEVLLPRRPLETCPGSPLTTLPSASTLSPPLRDHP